MKTSQRLRLSTGVLPFLRRNLRNLRIVPKRSADYADYSKGDPHMKNLTGDFA